MRFTNRTKFTTTTAAAGLFIFGLAAGPAPAEDTAGVNSQLTSQDDDLVGSLELFSVHEDDDGFRAHLQGRRDADRTRLSGGAVSTDDSDRTGGHGNLTTEDERLSSDLTLQSSEDGDRSALDVRGRADEDDGRLDVSITNHGDKDRGVTLSDLDIDVRTDESDESGESDEDGLLGDLVDTEDEGQKADADTEASTEADAHAEIEEEDDGLLD